MQQDPSGAADRGAPPARASLEEALRQSEARFAFLLRHVPAVLWTTDRELRFLSVHGTRAEREDLAKLVVGRPLSSIQEGRLDAPAVVAHRRALAGEAVSYEDETGGVRYEGHVQPLRDQTGAISGVMGVGFDITAQAQALTRLRASEERFRALVEHATDLVAIVDTDGIKRYASPSYETVLGYQPAAVVGRSAYEFMHPDEQARSRDFLARALRQRAPVGPEPFHFRHHDGSWRLLMVLATNMLDAPAVGGLVVNARDVTAQVALEEQLRQAQRMEALGQLAGGVAHDFNNILAAITGFVELLRLDLAPEDARQQELGEILRAAQRGAAVTRQLLAFSRRQALQTEVLDLAAVARDIARMLRPLLPASITLETPAGTTALPVRADRAQLEQVLMNLAVNARDAMPDGGVLAIDVHERSAPGETPTAVLTVRDTGVGMSEEIRRRIFEPFFTTKAPGQGTGLGLAMVYGIVRQLGGAVDVQSAPGAGSAFAVSLPLTTAAAATSNVSAAAPRDPERAVGAPERRQVLVVEDEAQIRSFVTRLLEGAGYVVVAAANGVEALQLVEQGHATPHVVLSDAAMPEMGGRELAARLASLRPELPVVLMSGYPELLSDPRDADTPRASWQEQVAGFVEKPFTRARLLEALAAALSHA